MEDISKHDVCFYFSLHPILIYYYLICFRISKQTLINYLSSARLKFFSPYRTFLLLSILIASRVSSSCFVNILVSFQFGIPFSSSIRIQQPNPLALQLRALVPNQIEIRSLRWSNLNAYNTTSFWAP